MKSEGEGIIIMNIVQFVIIIIITVHISYNGHVLIFHWVMNYFLTLCYAELYNSYVNEWIVFFGTRGECGGGGVLGTGCVCILLGMLAKVRFTHLEILFRVWIGKWTKDFEKWKWVDGRFMEKDLLLRVLSCSLSFSFVFSMAESHANVYLNIFP